MSTKNFYNFYTIFRDLKNGLVLFLDENGIDYSLTGNQADWAFLRSLYRGRTQGYQSLVRYEHDWM